VARREVRDIGAVVGFMPVDDEVDEVEGGKEGGEVEVEVEVEFVGRRR
jgi:hypothetical protein